MRIAAPLLAILAFTLIRANAQAASIDLERCAAPLHVCYAAVQDHDPFFTATLLVHATESADGGAPSHLAIVRATSNGALDRCVLRSLRSCLALPAGDDTVELPMRFEPKLGTLSRTQIERTMRRQLQSRAESCVHAAERRGPVKGGLILDMILREDGTVFDAMVASKTLRGERLAQCIVAAAKRLTFPAPGGPMRFDYPLAVRQ